MIKGFSPMESFMSARKPYFTDNVKNTKKHSGITLPTEGRRSAFPFNRIYIILTQKDEELIF